MYLKHSTSSDLGLWIRDYIHCQYKFNKLYLMQHTNSKFSRFNTEEDLFQYAVKKL